MVDESDNTEDDNHHGYHYDDYHDDDYHENHEKSTVEIWLGRPDIRSHR